VCICKEILSLVCSLGVFSCQVKIEDYDKDGSVSAGAKVLNNACVDRQPHLTHTSVEAEEVRCALKSCSVEALIDLCCK
jgi:hypothetical protein